MRLILGFIFFGLLFYGIYIYAPDTFQTLVSWAAKVFEFAQGVIDNIKGKPAAPPPPPGTLPNALFFVS